MSPISALSLQSVRFPLMLQRWEHLSFLHWPYDPETIRRHVPRELTLDTFEGKAWVGLTPFLLTNLRLPFAPPVGWLSAFPETNVRTYVRARDGKPAVWFFTLECDRALAVAAARLTFGLPYRWANMTVQPGRDSVTYRSKRKNARTHIVVQRRGPLVAGDFDNFLTARYRLYTHIAGQPAFADIDHAPWPLERGEIRELEQDLIEACGLPAPAGNPLVHHSCTLDVRIGRPHIVPASVRCAT